MNLNLSVQTVSGKTDTIGPRTASFLPIGSKLGSSVDSAYEHGLAQLEQEKEARDEGASFWGTIFGGPLVGTRIGQPIEGSPLESSDATNRVAIDPQLRPSKIYARGVADQFSDVVLDSESWPPKEAYAPHVLPPLFTLTDRFTQAYSKLKSMFST